MPAENARDRLRRYYHDLVQGRSRVRISPAASPTGTVEPVFLVGAYRSGTTLVRLMLDSHPAFAVPPETTFLKELQAVAGEDSLAGFEDMGFDKRHVLGRMRGFADYFYESYAASAGKRRWIDKSPEYVWHLDWLRQLYPDARFVLLTRFALDQVHSHVSSTHALETRLQPYRRHASEDVRIVASRYWAASVSAQLAFRSSAPESSILLRYEDVCADPQTALEPVFDFLGESWSDEVLRFGHHAHDFGRADSRARTSKSVSISTGRYADWPESVLTACWEICHDRLGDLGWSRGRTPDSPQAAPSR